HLRAAAPPLRAEPPRPPPAGAAPRRPSSRVRRRDPRGARRRDRRGDRPPHRLPAGPRRRRRPRGGAPRPAAVAPALGPLQLSTTHGGRPPHPGGELTDAAHTRPDLLPV